MASNRTPNSSTWDDLTFSSHIEAEQSFDSLFRPYFEILPEVNLIARSGERFRIDRLIYDDQYALGVEIKPKFLFMQDYTKALKQAADYRDSAVNDARLPSLMGQQLSGVLVFPRWTGLHDNGEREYAFEAFGMELLAGTFRVGTAGTRKSKPEMVVGQQCIWNTQRRWSENAAGILQGKRPSGSTRRADGARPIA